MTVPAEAVELEVEQPPELPRPKRMHQIRPAEIALAESKRNIWSCIVPSNVTIEALQSPDFWPLVANNFNRRDLIEVQPEDGRWWAQFLVRDTGLNYAVVHLLHKINLLPLHVQTVDALPSGHTCEFLGPERQWGILRGSEVLRAEFPTKGEACQWIIEALRT